jgi:hypothetical protein
MGCAMTDIPSPAAFVRDALYSAGADADTLAAAVAGLDRHHRRARQRLVEDLLLACTVREKLTALDAYIDRQDEIERAQYRLAERLRGLADAHDVPSLPPR